MIFHAIYDFSMLKRAASCDFISILSLVFCASGLFSQVNLDSLRTLGAISRYPGIPSGVQASDGTFSFFVRVNWKKTPNVHNYHVLRASQFDRNHFVELPVSYATPLQLTKVEDYDVRPGVLYYYTIVGEDYQGTLGVRSSTDSGYIPWRGPIASPLPLPQPNQFPTKIQLSWTPVYGAERYRLHLSHLAPAENWAPLDGYFDENSRLLDTELVGTTWEGSADILSGGSLYWTVQALGQSLASAFSPATLVSGDDILQGGRDDTGINLGQIIVTAAGDSLNVQVNCALSDTQVSLADRIVLFFSTDQDIDPSDPLVDWMIASGTNCVFRIKRPAIAAWRYLLLVPTDGKGVIFKDRGKWVELR